MEHTKHFLVPQAPFTIDVCEYLNISMTFNPYSMISSNMNFHPSNSHRLKSCEPMTMVGRVVMHHYLHTSNLHHQKTHQ